MRNWHRQNSPFGSWHTSGVSGAVDDVRRELDGGVTIYSLVTPPNLVLVERSDGVPVVALEGYDLVPRSDDVRRELTGAVVIYYLNNPPSLTLTETANGTIQVGAA
jgi:hypothetical protein